MSYKVPVLFVSGEEDFSCPTGMLEDCLDNISAPVKKLEIISKSTHTCFYDRSQEFMRTINEFICSI